MSTHKISLLKTPTGRFIFVGTVPAQLAYTDHLGQTLNADTANYIAKCATPSRLMVKTRSWGTASSALQAAKELGCEVQL